ncbi:acetylornithine deacetylase [Saccharophagus degradans]|uniref:Acetylornithine deacetylase n=1 Tax=Saccharophagus degradans TaxID=86304 RepID=A0AAW7X754_9GAMM|nr:acetylornithine deacetylase [Saccharophagus degradans]MDO6423437.1 acetylornithine deacetylase [Saccharophagus degradans]MDO6606842.1 acetylornithine deacetylase [Saccharophagus degradans]
MPNIAPSDVTVFKQRLQQLIATPSISCTSAEYDMSNKSVVELLAQWFEDLGFKTEILPVEGFAGKYNLLATRGTGPGGLVLSGHTDTVPCDPNRWQQDPFQLTEKEQRFYGLGTTDMKGFFPVVLAALEGLDLNKLQQPVMILATADEESSMCGARALAALGRPKARCAVIGEPTELKPIRMHKGIMMESVRVQGLAGHSSNPALGHNALDTMTQVLNELILFRGELQSRYQHAGFDINVPTLNLGCIHGGDNPNRICGACELHFDLRALPGMSNHDLHAEIEKRLQAIGDKNQTPISLTPLFPGIASFEEQADSALVKAAERLSGYQAESVAFATEAPFLQDLGMETIVMGPGTIDCAHQPNEYLAHDQIQPGINIVRGLIEQFCF